ncbi:CoA transferase [Streptomyces tubbatahanensis]|uniref:CoA transferase n=1 Tax=Streptomyces tubbatahanensis TaxID=2923272 RepID=A0ABY3XZR1_9ACTN|nr:CoA transferase [Streptomyces tubbatahanensis]UNS99831.1 CoA transferase [Streptomyces tubbatahanensis]
MTTSPPRTRVAPAPAVAHRVADRLLALVGDPGTATVPYRIDWAGPVDLPLHSEQAVQAACGIMEVHGRAAGRPTPLAVDYAGTVAGVLAAQGVCAALLGRAAGADVARVRTSVSQAALFSVSQYLAAATAEGDEDEPPPATARREAPTEVGHRPFVSADGVAFELEALDAERWLGFWQRLGAPADALRAGWRPFQQRFATATCLLPHALHRAAGAAPYAAIRSAAAQAGADVLSLCADPRGGAAPPAWRLTELGHATAGAAREAVRTPQGSGHPLLAGLRVVESTRRVQGPLAGHVLRLLGAEVVRIEPPGGDPMRGMPPMAGPTSARFRALNDGKQVVEADLTTGQGRHTVRELVAGADVFLHNWAPGKAARLGLDAADLSALRPGLVHAWASGWGDALGQAPPVGTDFLVQAHSGLAAAVRPAHLPPAPSLMTLTDVLGGLLSAQAVLAGLLARDRTGRGQRADSSLLSAAALVPRPRQRVRWGPWETPPATADGHLWLGESARAHPEQLGRVIGADAARCPDAAAARLRTATSTAWAARFAAAGLTALPVGTDLARLAAGPRFSAAVRHDAYARPLTPWEFL